MAMTVTCPTCGGPVELVGQKPGCLIGHEFDQDDLQIQVTREAARALWSAVRALEDTASTARWRLGRPLPPAHLQATIEKAESEAAVIRGLLNDREGDDSETTQRPQAW